MNGIHTGDKKFIENPCVNRILKKKPPAKRTNFDKLSTTGKVIITLSIALIVQQFLLLEYSKTIETETAQNYRQMIQQITQKDFAKPHRAKLEYSEFEILPNTPDCSDGLMMQLNNHLICS